MPLIFPIIDLRFLANIKNKNKEFSVKSKTVAFNFIRKLDKLIYYYISNAIFYETGVSRKYKHRLFNINSNPKIK